ncbi:MAG: 5'-nucleotidase C-terminal domain-containing protein [Actinomycetota bacterium]|nr:5'-nucleotidase C-terminal domain-containing protein [Actinomycetota bacterium]
MSGSRVFMRVLALVFASVFMAAACGQESAPPEEEEGGSSEESSMMEESAMEPTMMEETTTEETTSSSMDAAAGSGETVDIQILGINDFEGNLETAEDDDGDEVGGAAYLASALDERADENAEGTIRVHVGDLVGASPLISSYFHDEPTIGVTNLMDFDVATLGNHEFDEGGDEMFRLLEGGHRDDGMEIKNGENTSDPDFEGANYPYVSANVAYADSGELVLPPYEVIERDGVEIGFIGVVTEAAPEVVTPDAVAPFEFLDISDSVNEAAEELQNEGVETIVVLAHEGNENEDVDPPEGNIVEEVEQMDDSVDAVVAGNTEFTIDEEIGGKYVVQAAGTSTDYAVADLEVDTGSGDVVEAGGEVVAFDNGELEPDEEVQALVEESQAEIAPIAETNIGEASETISDESNEAGESPIGDLIADAQRDFAEADFAFMNPGGIRAEIPSGEVTYEDLFTVQPFSNQLVRLEMTGEQIQTLLEQQFELEVPTVLQISGLTYSYDENAPEGERVGEIAIDGGGELDPSATYTVALNSFLVTGGDGFTTFTEGENSETLGSDLDALVEYVENLEQPFTAPEDEGRITAEG